LDTLKLVSDCLAAGITPLLIGPPGVGKTAILDQAAKLQHRACITLHAPSLDSADVGGLHVPDLNTKRLQRLLIGDIADVVAATTPTLLIVDEIGQASPSVQAAISPLLYSRRIGEFALPDCVAVAGATNRREDRAGAGAVLSHLISRCAVYNVQADLQQWLAWAVPEGVHELVVGFLRFRTPLLHQFDPQVDATRPYACPRSWAQASRLLLSGAQVGREHLSGIVGEAAATEFTAYAAIASSLPDVDKLLADPESIKKPTSPSACYALAASLAWRASDVAHRSEVLRAADRLHKIGLGEYAALVLRDAIAKNPGLVLSQEWSALASGPLGKLVIG